MRKETKPKKIVNSPIEFSSAAKDFIKGLIYRPFPSCLVDVPIGNAKYRLNVGIKSWFEVNFHDEVEFLEDVDETTTFIDALLALLNGECVYERVKINDSIIREFIFMELTYALYVNYSIIYYMYIYQGYS